MPNPFIFSLLSFPCPCFSVRWFFLNPVGLHLEWRHRPPLLCFLIGSPDCTWDTRVLLSDISRAVTASATDGGHVGGVTVPLSGSVTRSLTSLFVSLLRVILVSLAMATLSLLDDLVSVLTRLSLPLSFFTPANTVTRFM